MKAQESFRHRSNIFQKQVKHIRRNTEPGPTYSRTTETGLEYSPKQVETRIFPEIQQQFKAFKHEKTSQAQININPSKLGQKFGDLFVYVKSKDGTTMRDIVIYKKDADHSDQLFIAKC